PGGRDPGGAGLVWARLELDQIGRTGRRAGATDRQESDRPAWRNLHTEVEAAYRDRGGRHLPAGARDAGAGADFRCGGGLDRAARRHVLELVGRLLVVRGFDESRA